MESLKKLHQIKEKYHIDKKIVFKNYLSEANIEELIFSPMNPAEFKQTAKEDKQVLYLPTEKFYYEKILTKDQKYKISDLKFYFKTEEHTEELMDRISEDGYIPFDADMLVTLLIEYPDLIDFFNVTTSSYIEENNDKQWISAYFGNLVKGKTKWRKDENDLDENFIIPTYKTIEII